MCYIRALVLLACLVIPSRPAIANILSIADDDNFHQLNLRIRPLQMDLAELIIHPPIPRGVPQGGIESAVRTQDCIIRLAGNFDALGAKLDIVGTLVGLAARMVDSADELFVLRLLSIH